MGKLSIGAECIGGKADWRPSPSLSDRYRHSPQLALYQYGGDDDADNDKHHHRLHRATFNKATVESPDNALVSMTVTKDVTS